MAEGGSDQRIRRERGVVYVRKSQPIAGVSGPGESVVEEVYPSIAAFRLGKWLHLLMEGLPRRGSFRLGYLVFMPLVWPLALLIYLGQKIFGDRYLITNRHVRVVRGLNGTVREEIRLSDVEGIRIVPGSELSFFRSGDVELVGDGGKSLLVMHGVVMPRRVVSVLVASRQARAAVAGSLEAIRLRRQVHPV